MCQAGECSATVPRVALVEAAREAGTYIGTTPQPPPNGKLTKGHKRKPLQGA